MLKLLKYEFSSSMHKKGLLLMMVCVILLALFFWNFIEGLLPLSTMEKSIEQDGLMLYATYWGGEAYVPPEDLSYDQQVEGFLNYYISMQAPRVFQDSAFLAFGTIIISAYVVGTSFTRRTVSMAIFRGHPRWKILIAKLLHYYIIVIMVSLVSLFVFFCMKFRLQWITVLSGYMLRSICIWLYLCISFTSLPFLIAYICKSIFKTTLINFAALFVIALSNRIFSSGGLFGEGVFDFFPLMMLTRDELWASELLLSRSEWIGLTVVPMAFILVCAVVSYLFFRRAELR